MRPRASSSGFSLIELIMAMTLTLIVSGAIYGLLTSGQDSFKREPEVSDMQQNLRMAMDLIMRDAEAAGEAIPAGPTGTGVKDPGMPYVQVFTVGLDNGGACKDTTPPCPRPFRPNSTTERTDDLEMLVGSSDCGAESVCGYEGQKADNIRTKAGSSCVSENDSPIIFMNDGTWTMRFITDTNQDRAGLNDCVAGKDHAKLIFNPNKSPNNPSPADVCRAAGVDGVLGTTTGAPDCKPVYIMDASLVTYRIAVGSDGVPNLERRSTKSINGTLNNSFQVVARGIEDLQVQYARAREPYRFLPDSDAGGATGGAPRIEVGPPLDPATAYGSILTQVRITLSARTNATNLAGQMADARGKQFIRSSLTSTAAVRPALLQLSMQNGNQPLPTPAPSATPSSLYWQ